MSDLDLTLDLEMLMLVVKKRWCSIPALTDRRTVSDVLYSTLWPWRQSATADCSWQLT